MNGVIELTKASHRDLEKLDLSVRALVFKGIEKVSQYPLSQREGGYGKPLGNAGSINLTGYYRIKFRELVVRVVYQIVRTETVMKIIVVSARDDNQVYKEAFRRIQKQDS